MAPIYSKGNSIALPPPTLFPAKKGRAGWAPRKHLGNLLLTLIAQKENSASPDWVSETLFIIEKLLQDIHISAETDMLPTKFIRETEGA